MSNSRRLLFSVKAKDFEMATFSVGGHGGGGKDTSNSGVRLTHPASGAVGEGREHRTNHQNRKSAFLKLVKTEKFQNWHRVECARHLGQAIRETPEEIMARVDLAIAQGLSDGSIVVEEYEVKI